MAAMILFLDCDGVLHPAGGELFSCLPHLWTILRARLAVQVVFSTSWRETFNFDTLLDFVTSNGGEDLAHRFIGSNPVLVNARSDSPREAECLAWLGGNGMDNRSWLAIDDDASQFSDPNQLYRVDGQTGLTATDVHKILQRMGAHGHHVRFKTSS